jgi:hypothetical protein
MHEQILMKLGMYILTPEPISAAHFINPSHQTVFVCVSLGKHAPAATNTCKKQKTCYARSFPYGPCLLKGESVGLCIPLSLVDIGSVNSCRRQERIGGGVVLYAVRIYH